MGQAFRRASGRIQSSSVETSSSSSSQLKKAVERRPPPVTVDKLTADKVTPDSGINADKIPLEERDSQYDAMLSRMVGRIRAKPGGKLEMGEAIVVEKYNRPMPKLRNTTPDSGRYEGRTAPPGTLNVAQIRHVILLYQGKADDHDGPMNIDQISEKFRVDPEQVQRIVQHLSLPPVNTSKQKYDQ
ncbi:uncharacterized protein LOC132294672 isoform X2 [Cornus florida]|uniref:uncharacterized protein LOC132294672 isoform X2 n=1 Tax=Cornus florida TaxID=4283 RepID=UPI00289C9BEC|nr:uncharacterized protein LOC132294672 isoform X2 [Cornus florida]